MPARGLEPSNQVTPTFKSWWLKKNGNYFEENRHHLVGSSIPPPSQPKLPRTRGENQGGKQLCLVENRSPPTPEHIVVDNDESCNSTDDHHWNRPSKKVKATHDAFFDGVDSASSIPSGSIPLVRFFLSSFLFFLPS